MCAGWHVAIHAGQEFVTVVTIGPHKRNGSQSWAVLSKPAGALTDSRQERTPDGLGTGDAVPEPLCTPGGIGRDEPFAEFVERTGDVTRILWLEATGRRAEIAVPALLSVGYRLVEPPAPPGAGAALTFKASSNGELTEAEAIAHLTKDVLVAVVIEPAKGFSPRGQPR